MPQDSESGRPAAPSGLRGASDPPASLPPPLLRPSPQDQRDLGAPAVSQSFSCLDYFAREKRRPPSLFTTPEASQSMLPQTHSVTNRVPQCSSEGDTVTPQRPRDAEALRSPQLPCTSALVSLSDDRSVLRVGPYRVSREGCLTMQNVLLLNRAATSPSGSCWPRTEPAEDEKGKYEVYRKVSSMPHIKKLLRPAKLLAPVDRVVNKSFTLHSSSMDVPYSPITYSLDANPTAHASTRTNALSPMNAVEASCGKGNTCYSSVSQEESPLFEGKEYTSSHSGERSTPVSPNAVQYSDIHCLRHVGEGASASVFVAEHTPTKRMLAVKRIDLTPLFLQWNSPMFRQQQKQSQRRFTVNPRLRQLQRILARELQALHLSYRSPFMVKVYNAFLDSDSMKLDLVLEYMHYGSLDHLQKLLRHNTETNEDVDAVKMERERAAGIVPELHGGVPERLVAVVGEQLLRGVHHMHERGFMHRDIKPGNVLVNNKGIVKLSDFGLSQKCQGSSDSEGLNEVASVMEQRLKIHTPSYFTPGQTALEFSRTALGVGADGGGMMGYLDRSAFQDTTCSTDMHCSGTNKYMSPERQHGKAHGRPCDVWAVGMTLAEFGVGEYPVDLSGCADAFEYAHRMEAPLDLRRYKRTCAFSEEFLDFIRISMLPAPEERPTAPDLLEHPFFRQWTSPFNFEEYLQSRIPLATDRQQNVRNSA